MAVDILLDIYYDGYSANKKKILVRASYLFSTCCLLPHSFHLQYLDFE